MATARAREGSGTVTRDLKDSDIVRVGPGDGIETTVAQAVRLGYLVKNTDGTFADIDPTQSPDLKRAEERKEAEAAGPDLSEALDVEDTTAETLANWSGALKGIGANPVQVIGAIMRNPSELPEALALLGRQHKIPTEKLLSDVRSLGASVSGAMAEYVSKLGVRDFPAFWQHVETHYDPNVIASAMSQLLFLGDARPLGKFASHYVSSLGGSTREAVEVVINGRKLKVSEAYAKRHGLI